MPSIEGSSSGSCPRPGSSARRTMSSSPVETVRLRGRKVGGRGTESASRPLGAASGSTRSSLGCDRGDRKAGRKQPPNARMSYTSRIRAGIGEYPRPVRVGHDLRPRPGSRARRAPRDCPPKDWRISAEGFGFEFRCRESLSKVHLRVPPRNRIPVPAFGFVSGFRFGLLRQGRGPGVIASRMFVRSPVSGEETGSERKG